MMNDWLTLLQEFLNEGLLFLHEAWIAMGMDQPLTVGGLTVSRSVALLALLVALYLVFVVLRLIARKVRRRQDRKEAQKSLTTSPVFAHNPDLAGEVAPAFATGSFAETLEDTPPSELIPQEMLKAFDALPQPVWMRSKDLTLVYCNQAYADACGTTPDAVLSEQKEIAVGELGEDGKSLALSAKEALSPQSKTLHLVIGGERKLFEISESPLTALSEGGSALAFIGRATDYSAIESAQTALDRLATAQDNILETLTTGIVIYGADQRVQFFNTAFTRLWRLAADWLEKAPTFGEVLDKLRTDRRIPEHADYSAFKAKQEGLFKKLLEPKTEMLHLPDERTVKQTIVPHPSGGLMMSFEDVTDRVALERNYQTLTDVQRETLDNLQEGIAVFGSDGKLQLLNPNFCRIWQIDGPALLQQDAHFSHIIEAMRPFFDNQDDAAVWPEVQTKLSQLFTERKNRNGRISRVDESILDYTVVALPDGATLISFMDNTANVTMEKALVERNEALVQADKMKTKFIADMSYELRTPLNTIVGFTQMLQHTDPTTPEISAEKRQEYVTHIEKAAAQLRHLIDDILDSALIQAGYIKLDKSTFPVKETLKAVALSYERQILEKKLTLALNCPEDVGSVTLDKQRFSQIVANLLSNSIQYTKSGGQIALRAKKEDGAFIVSVQDNGIGIAKEDQQRIFNKFERGSNTAEARVSGTGLGLSLVKEYMDLHGGTISIESAPGKGTTIACRFPEA